MNKELDLIDRNELYNQIRLYLNRHSLGETTAQTTLTIGEIASIIADIPTVEAPIRHGKWIKTFWCEAQDPITGDIEKKYKYDCPVCGYHTGHQGSYFNYCPNCGTKMEGE